MLPENYTCCSSGKVKILLGSSPLSPPEAIALHMRVLRRHGFTEGDKIVLGYMRSSNSACLKTYTEVSAFSVSNQAGRTDGSNELLLRSLGVKGSIHQDLSQCSISEDNV